VIENADGTTLLHNPQLAWNAVRTFEVSRNNITWLRDILNAQHSLYAYAKAFELLHAWINVPDDEDDAPALDKYSQHLVSMGMGVSEDADEFLETYRAAALAQAEGRNT
jgi:hypothetical protein